MPYLAVNEAIRARLAGRPPEFAAPIQDLPSSVQQAGVVVGKGGEASVQSVSAPEATVNVANVKVPIFDYDKMGYQHEHIYPSIAFMCVDLEPRFEDYIYPEVNFNQNDGNISGGDEYQFPVRGSEDEVIDNGTLYGTPTTPQDLGRAPRMVLRRRVEEPWNYMFDIRVYSTDDVLTAHLVRYIQTVLPVRHYIRVSRLDGSFKDLDIFFNGYSKLDNRKAVLENPGIMREYCRVLRYTVEGYLDNTDESVLTNRIRERDIDRS